MPAGRPTHYSLEVARKICKVVATTTMPLQKMCDTYDFFPSSKSTIYEWRIDYKEFADLYVLAKQHQAELLAEEIIEIADYDVMDMIESEKGYVPNAAKVARDRLKVDTRKWIACKLLPKVYGDKQETKQEVTVVMHEDALKSLK